MSDLTEEIKSWISEPVTDIERFEKEELHEIIEKSDEYLKKLLTQHQLLHHRINDGSREGIRMSDLERYNFSSRYGVEEVIDGEYISYTDYESLQEECNTLREQVEEWKLKTVASQQGALELLDKNQKLKDQLSKYREVVKSELNGIDKTETEDEHGWWETSAGAAFGKNRLDQLISQLKDEDNE